MEKNISNYDDVLGPNGLIAQRLSHYEHREEQLEMARSVTDAIRNKTHLAIEAGTGVGKSFAYLVPAILYAVEDQIASPNKDLDQDNTDDYEERKLRRVVISTHTISLQEQIMGKDIPFLRSILPYEFSATLVKGRGNYICLRRLAQCLKKGESLFENDYTFTLERIVDWSKKTADGTLSDLPSKPPTELWMEIACEQGNCLGKTCPFFDKCFYNRARRRVSNTQILVVNHALLFSDLALRQGSEYGILPKYELLIVDEAHTMEQVAADHLGFSLTQGQIDFTLNRLFSERTFRGLLSSPSDSNQNQEEDTAQDIIDITELHKAQDLVMACRMRADEMFNSLMNWLDNRPGSNGRVREKDIVTNTLGPALLSLGLKIKEIAVKNNDQGRRSELASAARKLIQLVDSLNVWFPQNDETAVYWLEQNFSRGKRRITMEAAPIDIGPLLRENLFGKIPSVIMTSATLSTGNGKKKHYTPAETKKAFLYFRSRIGLTDIPSFQVGSPFDYRNQVTLVQLRHFPEPNENNPAYQNLFRETLKRYLTETDGGAFVLFTSYAFLKKMSTEFIPWFTEKNMPFFSQGDKIPRSKMLDEFKKTTRGVLFGTDSFWQGVDVPGNALRNVIITKFPFLVPGQPLTEARMEAIEAHGGNSFRDFQLPQAILKFKQGFGRLIRTRTDKGLVIIMDSRINTKSYGRLFLEALPDCNIRIDG